MQMNKQSKKDALTLLTLWRAVVLISSCAFAFIAFPVTSAFAGPTTASGSSSIGIVIDALPTTIPDQTSTTLPSTPTTLTTEDSLANQLPPPVDVETTGDSGIAGSFKAFARTTKELIKGIVSGRPVAEVLQDVLPAPVAAVVVPAVRTASTFAFPIGLAGAVLAFLLLQQRIDSSDPKLTAAPIAHDDDVVTFT